MSHENDLHALPDLEARLAALESALNAHYQRTGKCVLEIAEREQATINALVEEIIDVRRTLSHNRHDMRCGHCQHNNPCRSQYCNACGHALKAQQEEEDI